MARWLAQVFMCSATTSIRVLQCLDGYLLDVTSTFLGSEQSLTEAIAVALQLRYSGRWMGCRYPATLSAQEVVQRMFSELCEVLAQATGFNWNHAASDLAEIATVTSPSSFDPATAVMAL